MRALPRASTLRRVDGYGESEKTSSDGKQIGLARTPSWFVVKNALLVEVGLELAPTKPSAIVRPVLHNIPPCGIVMDDRLGVLKEVLLMTAPKTPTAAPVVSTKAFGTYIA